MEICVSICWTKQGPIFCLKVQIPVFYQPVDHRLSCFLYHQLVYHVLGEGGGGVVEALT